MMRNTLCLIVMLLMTGGASVARATSPTPPPDPVAVAFDVGDMKEGREIAAARLADSIKRIPPQRSIKTLDADTLAYGNALSMAVQSIGHWIHDEGVHLYLQDGSDEDFITHAWEPIFKASKDLVPRLDIAIDECQKLMDASGGGDAGWKPRLSNWRLFRNALLQAEAVLANKAHRPDLVKQVFDLGGKIGQYADAQAFMAQPPDPTRIFGSKPPPSILSPEDQKAVCGLLERWFTAVGKRDRDALRELYADPGQADRLVENGLFDNFRFQQVKVLAERLGASKIDNKSVSLRVKFPAKTIRGQYTYFQKLFTLSHSQGTWKFVNIHEEKLSRTQQNAFNKMIAMLVAAVAVIAVVAAIAVWRQRRGENRQSGR